MTQNHSLKHRARLESKITGDKYAVALQKVLSRKLEPSLQNLLSDKDYLLLTSYLNRNSSSALTLFSGLAGTGKTTTLSASLKYLDEQQSNKRTVVIDGGEIEQLSNGATPVEEQSRNLSSYFNSSSSVSQKDLILGALRMRSDYIIVGEIREASAMSSLSQAANTGYRTMATIHAGNELTGLNTFLRQNKLSSLTGVIQHKIVHVENIGKVYLYAVIPLSLEVIKLLEKEDNAGVEALLKLQGIKTMRVKVEELVAKGILTVSLTSASNETFFTAN